MRTKSVMLLIAAVIVILAAFAIHYFGLMNRLGVLIHG